MVTPTHWCIVVVRFGVAMGKEKRKKRFMDGMIQCALPDW